MNKKTLTIIGVSIATAFIISTIYLFMTKEEVSVSQKPEMTESAVEEKIDLPQLEAEEDLQNEQGENVIPTEVKESEILYNADGSIDMSNWKTYRNEEYGFEVKYPNEYTTNSNYLYIASSKDISFFKNNNKDVPIISIGYGNDRLNKLFASSDSVASFIDQQFDMHDKNKTYILRNNLTAHLVEIGGHYNVSALLIPRENSIFIILMNPTQNKQLNKTEFAIINSLHIFE